jgi:hypothetical protein
MVSVVRFDRQQNTQGNLYYHTVQVVFTSWTNVTSFTTYYAYQTLNGGQLTISPLYSNSKFHLIANVQAYGANVGGMNVGLNRTIAGSTVRLVGGDGSGGTADTWAGSGDGAAPANTNSMTINRNWLDSPGVAAGTPVQYNVLGGLWSAGTAYFGYSGYPMTSSLTIWEIQS